MPAPFNLPPGYLTSGQAAARLGIPFRTLMRWVEEGLVEPYAATLARRAPRLRAPDHLRQARWIQTLRAAGVCGPELHGAVAQLREGWGALVGQFLVFDRHTGEVAARSEGAVLECLKDHGRHVLFYVEPERG